MQVNYEKSFPCLIKVWNAVASDEGHDEIRRHRRTTTITTPLESHADVRYIRQVEANVKFSFSVVFNKLDYGYESHPL